MAKETIQNAQEMHQTYQDMFNQVQTYLQPYTLENLRHNIITEFREKAEQVKNKSGHSLWSMVEKPFTQIISQLGGTRVERMRYPAEGVVESTEVRQATQDRRKMDIDRAMDYFDHKDKKKNDDFEL